jgi:hypothetical protein
VQSVISHGANLVHKSQQAFYPAANGAVVIELLYYELTIRARDALFGSALHGSLRLENPDGSSRAVELTDSGNATIHLLPRGEYTVSLPTSGLGRQQPVTLSKDAVVDLQVMTLTDIAVILLVGVVLGVALLAVGRPNLVRRAIRLARRPARSGGQPA